MYHVYMIHLLINIPATYNGGRLTNHPCEHDNMLFYLQLTLCFSRIHFPILVKTRVLFLLIPKNIW